MAPLLIWVAPLLIWVVPLLIWATPLLIWCKVRIKLTSASTEVGVEARAELGKKILTQKFLAYIFNKKNSLTTNQMRFDTIEINLVDVKANLSLN